MTRKELYENKLQMDYFTQMTTFVLRKIAKILCHECAPDFLIDFDILQTITLTKGLLCLE